MLNFDVASDLSTRTTLAECKTIALHSQCMHHIVCLQCTTLSADTLRLQKCKEAVIKRRDSLVRELAGLTLQLVLQVELYSSPRNLQRILYGRTPTRDTFARFVDNVSGRSERAKVFTGRYFFSKIIRMVCSKWNVF